MSRITGTAEITRDDLPDAPEDEWLDQFLSSYNETTRQLVSAVSGGIAEENTVNVTKSYVMQHGVTYRNVKNPLRVPIQGIVCTRCVGLETNTDGSFTRKTYGLAQPSVQWHPSTKQDGSVDVTVNFAPPKGAVSLQRQAAQTIVPNPTTVPIQFDARILADEGALSCDIATTLGTPPVNSKIVCAVAGKVAVTATMLIDRTNADTRLCYIGVNGPGSTYRWGYCVDGVSGSNVMYFGVTMAAEIPVNAGDYLSSFVLHTTPGNTTTLTGTQQGPMFQARYVAPPVGTTGKVTLQFLGG